MATRYGRCFISDGVAITSVFGVDFTEISKQHTRVGQVVALHGAPRSLTIVAERVSTLANNLKILDCTNIFDRICMIPHMMIPHGKNPRNEGVASTSRRDDVTALGRDEAAHPEERDQVVSKSGRLSADRAMKEPTRRRSPPNTTVSTRRSTGDSPPSRRTSSRTERTASTSRRDNVTASGRYEATHPEERDQVVSKSRRLSAADRAMKEPKRRRFPPSTTVSTSRSTGGSPPSRTVSASRSTWIQQPGEEVPTAHPSQKSRRTSSRTEITASTSRRDAVTASGRDEAEPH